MDTVNCFNCSTANPLLANYCIACGTLIACFLCSNKFTQKVMYCDQCGIEQIPKRFLKESKELHVESIVDYDNDKQKYLESIKEQAKLFGCNVLFVIPYNCSSDQNIANFIHLMAGSYSGPHVCIAIVTTNASPYVSTEREDLEFIRGYFKDARIFGYKSANPKPFKFY